MSKALNLIVLICYLILPIEASAKGSASDSDYVLPVANNELKVMSYNVQNLFDTSHDSGKEDYEFLPADHPEKSGCDDQPAKRAKACRELDWTEQKLSMKYNQIKKVLESQGDMPDVLVLVEVENPSVVGTLASILGYDGFRMTESPDQRGIDCAILYLKNKLTPIEYYQQPVTDALYPTRNLSVMTFRLSSSLGGGVFAVLPNHWPSQGNPTKARLVVAAAERALVDDLRRKYSNQELNYIITGDFNTIDSDSPHPIDTILLDKSWGAALVDVRAYSKKKRNPMIAKMPQATYYYGVENNWNEFDRFFVNPELTDGEGLDVDAMSYRIHAPGFLSKENADGEKIPFRYNHNSASSRYIGYSDHFGIVVKLKYN
jgi:Endonuclease/Exonuclease/phosphatase family